MLSTFLQLEKRKFILIEILLIIKFAWKGVGFGLIMQLKIIKDIKSFKAHDTLIKIKIKVNQLYSPNYFHI